MSSETLCDKALALARRGLAVFPLIPGSKRPLHKGGHNAATTEAWEIEVWWAQEPNANIGIYPDACDPALIVIDVEGPDGHDITGLDKAARLNADGALPLTLSVTTPSGGRHLYYQAPERGAYASGTRIAPGIDVRAHGGYVVAAGSRLADGREYGWEPIAPRGTMTILRPVPAPDALLAMLKKVGQRDPHADEWVVEPDLEENIDHAAKWLFEQDGVPRGSRGSTTYKLAAMLRDFGLSQDQALALLANMWGHKCSPALTVDELAVETAHAYLYAQNPAGIEAPSLGVDLLMAAVKAEPPPKRKWIMSRDETMHLTDPMWLVDKTVTDTGVVLLYGPWAGGKTLITLDMALSVAAGKPWFGHDTIQGRVIYVTGEGRAGIKARVLAWEASKNDGAPVTDFYFGHRMPQLFNPADVQSWIEEARSLNPLLVVIDTVSHAMTGRDENATKDAAEFMAIAMRIQVALRCAVVLVHHTGKDASKGARGSEEFSQKADTVLRVEAQGSGLDLLATLSMKKQKDGEPWNRPVILRAVESKPGIVLVVQTQNTITSSSGGAPVDVQKATWAATCISVLGDADPASLPLKVNMLAREAALRLLDPEEGNPEPLAQAIANWLRRTAPREGMGPYVAVRTSNLGNTSAYGLPVER